MFSMSRKSSLLVLVCACAAAAAARNVTGSGRSFAVFVSSITDEPFPDPFYDDDDGYLLFKVNRSAKGRNVTNITRMSVSEETLQFLTSPVSTILIPSFYTLVCLISVPINMCAVLAFYHRIRPKKPAAIYMLNLACADLVFAVLLPFKISYHFRGNNWIFGPNMCRVVTAAFYWNMYCSVLIIACISVDRLLAVAYPLDSLTWRRPRNAVIACVTMWVLSFAGSVPLVLREQTYHLTELDITTCHDLQRSDDLINHYKIYFIVLCCLLFFLPLLIILVSYTRVIWSLSRVPRGVPGRSRRRRRALVMASTVLVMFVLCFTPTNCLLLAHYLQVNNENMKSHIAPDGSYAAYLVFMCLGSLNCLLDPLVYYFGSSQCQKQLSYVLRCQKIPDSARIDDSSSSSYRSSRRAILKPSHTETTKMSSTDPPQKSLSSQYNKLLV